MIRTMFAGLALAIATLVASPALAQDQNGSLMGRPNVSVETGSVTLGADGSVTITCHGLTAQDQFLAAKLVKEVIDANASATISCAQAQALVMTAQADATATLADARGKAEIDHAVASTVQLPLAYFPASAFMDEKGKFNTNLPATTFTALTTAPASPPIFWDRENEVFATWDAAKIAAFAQRGDGNGFGTGYDLLNQFGDLNGPSGGQQIFQQTTTTQQQAAPQPQSTPVTTHQTTSNDDQADEIKRLKARLDAAGDKAGDEDFGS